MDIMKNIHLCGIAIGLLCVVIILGIAWMQPWGFDMDDYSSFYGRGSGEAYMAELKRHLMVAFVAGYGVTLGALKWACGGS